MQSDGISDRALHLQSYLGVAWVAGCAVFGFLVVRNSVECRIARQYLCQMSGFMCGLSMLALAGVGNNFEGYVMFVWIYGEFYCSEQYILMFMIFCLIVRNFLRRISLFTENVHLRAGEGSKFRSSMELRSVRPGNTNPDRCATGWDPQ